MFSATWNLFSTQAQQQGPRKELDSGEAPVALSPKRTQGQKKARRPYPPQQEQELKPYTSCIQYIQYIHMISSDPDENWR